MKSDTVAHQLLDVLREFGANRVFGIPGGAVAQLFAALLDRPDIQLVNAKHETGAAFMALGYSMATGRPGVVFTTAGPGITNALTGLASAHLEGVPVVLIAGEVPRTSFGRGALQEGSASGLDAVALARRMSKFSAQISRPGSAAAVMRKALSTAYSGRRGAAFLSLPLDVASAPGSTAQIGGHVQSSFEIDGNGCRRAMELLGAARRPMILAGAGSRDLTSRRALRRLAERLGVPVAVTTKGKGIFPEDHPLYLGIFGFGGHESVVEYLSAGVDVLLVCGSGLNDFSTNAWSPLLKASKTFIQIDIDAAQLGRNYAIDIGLVGPIAAVLSRMAEYGLERAVVRESPWTGPRYQPSEPSPKGVLTTAEVVQTMNACCPRDSVFTADMGEHLAIALHYLQVHDAGDFVTCLGFGSMGSGICAAIGYQLGAPQRRTFAVCGDGGFLMYGAELATAVQHGAATTFVIINDSRFNMVHHGLRDLYGATPDFSTQPIDFSGIAHAVGAVGRVVRTREELTAALTAPISGPLVLDVRVDPDCRLGGSQRVAALRQFQENPHG